MCDDAGAVMGSLRANDVCHGMPVMRDDEEGCSDVVMCKLQGIDGAYEGNQ